MLLTVAAIAFLTNLGGPRLWDRDEPRNAGCAREMLVAGDWVVPVFNDELRTHKPILLYWLMMLSYTLFGITEFAARFPSALLGVGTVLLTWFIGCRLFRPSAGLWAGIALATALMFGVASRAATPDAPLIFFSTLAIAVYVAGTTGRDVPGGIGTGQGPRAKGQGDNRRLLRPQPSPLSPFVRWFPDRWTAAGMYAVMGIAVLAKGPVGLVLPTAVIGMFLLIQRLPSPGPATRSTTDSVLARLGTGAVRLLRPFAPLHFLKTCWAMRPVTAVLAAATVALPWYVLVHLRTEGAWTEGFFVTHNFERATEAMEGHRGGILFYPVALIVGFFPWSIFWLPVLLETVRLIRRPPQTESSTDSEPSRWRDGSIFACCWIGVYLGLFTLARTKLPSYITPCYPAAALLTGLFIDRWLQGEYEFTPLWRRLAFGSLVLVGVGVAVVLPILAFLLLPGEGLLGLLGLIPLTAGIIALVCVERERQRLAMYATTAGAVLLTTTLFSVVTMRIDAHRPLEEIVTAIYGGTEREQVEIGGLSGIEPSWVFYAGQPIRDVGDLDDALRFLSTPHPGGRERVLLTVSSHLESRQDTFPEEAFEIHSLPCFLKREQLFVIKRHSSAMRTAGGTSPTTER
jgi:4-amino-4-deoxy-L-arabinose transferase-like glycosyltransferase